jgi:hypothetical protein|tara:strand:+ start:60 stop:398 length:339 start_codon:yes stop_codon:yes gene_type:complete
VIVILKNGAQRISLDFLGKMAKAIKLDQPQTLSATITIKFSEKSKNRKKNIQKNQPTVDDRQKKYASSEKGQESREKARKAYDERDVERRRRQKREYMRRKRRENPGYCKWK